MSEGASRGSGELLRLGNDPYWLPLALLAASDALVFATSIWAAYPIRFLPPVSIWFPLPEGWIAPPFSVFFHFGFLAALVGVLTFERLGFYHARIGADRKVHVLRILAGSVIASLILQFLLSLTATSLSRGARLIAFLMTVPLVVLAHYCLKIAHGRMLRHGVGYRRTLLLLDDPSEAESVLSDLAKGHGTEFSALGIIVAAPSSQSPEMSNVDVPESVPLVGTFPDLRRALASRSYDAVLVHLSTEVPGVVREAAALCETFGVDFFVEPKVFEKVLESVPLGGDFLLPVLSLGETPLSGSSIVMKRLVDLLGSTILILSCLPLWGLLAVLIKLESRGPVFYSQERIGADGRTFRILKFRSMSRDAEAESGPVWASADDPRRTGIGAWMRRWNVDETPQFINVFRGDMSLVGPRPERPYFVNQFKGAVPQYIRRHLVKSGITGWAQVNGLRGDTSIEERTQYDMWYIENWSFWLDLKILARTLFIRENAY
jgi:exopolysaccharide biosynthesis polyprenyl glycosylphosphotransferase